MKKTTVNNVIYYVTDSISRTASIGNGTVDGNGAVGILTETLFFEEFVTISNIKYEVTNISLRSFRSNKNIKFLIIHSRIRIIDSFAFDQCFNIESITFTEGSRLKKIGDATFYNCSIKTIIIPQSLKFIGGSSFVACSSLRSIFYCGTASVQNSIFDVGVSIFNPTSQDLKIYVSGRYKSEKFGKREIAVRNYESCYAKICTFRNNQNSNCFNVMNYLILINIIC